MMQFYKLRSFGELVSDTFNFFKQYGRNYFKIYFTLNGPLLILLVGMYMIGYQSFFKQLFSSNVEGESYYYQEYFQQNASLLVILGFVFLLIFAAMMLVMYSFPVLYMKRLAETRNPEITTQQMFAEIKANAGRFFLFLLCMTLVSVPVMAVVFAASFALIFLLFVGILVLFLAMPALVNIVNLTLFDYFNTGRGFFESLRYAVRAQFSYGRLNLRTPFWKYWGSMAVIYFMIQTVSSIFMIVPMIMLVGSGYAIGSTSGMQDIGSGTFFIIYMVFYAITMLLSFILSNALFVNAGLMYYDSRTDLHRREDFSEIDSIGSREV